MSCYSETQLRVDETVLRGFLTTHSSLQADQHRLAVHRHCQAAAVSELHTVLPEHVSVGFTVHTAVTVQTQWALTFNKAFYLQSFYEFVFNIHIL